MKSLKQTQRPTRKERENKKWKCFKITPTDFITASVGHMVVGCGLITCTCSVGSHYFILQKIRSSLLSLARVSTLSPWRSSSSHGRHRPTTVTKTTTTQSVDVPIGIGWIATLMMYLKHNQCCNAWGRGAA